MYVYFGLRFYFILTCVLEVCVICVGLAIMVALIYEFFERFCCCMLCLLIVLLFNSSVSFVSLLVWFTIIRGVDELFICCYAVDLVGLRGSSVVFVWIFPRVWFSWLGFGLTGLLVLGYVVVFGCLVDFGFYW